MEEDKCKEVTQGLSWIIGCICCNVPMSPAPLNSQTLPLPPQLPNCSPLLLPITMPFLIVHRTPFPQWHLLSMTLLPLSTHHQASAPTPAPSPSQTMKPTVCLLPITLPLLKLPTSPPTREGSLIVPVLLSPYSFFFHSSL